MVAQCLSVAADRADVRWRPAQLLEPGEAAGGDEAAQRAIDAGQGVDGDRCVRDEPLQLRSERFREGERRAGFQANDRCAGGLFIDTEEGEVQPVNAGPADGAEIAVDAQRRVARSNRCSDLCCASMANRSALCRLN